MTEPLVELTCCYCKRKAMAKRIPYMHEPCYDVDRRKWYSNRVCDYIWEYYCSNCSKRHWRREHLPFWELREDERGHEHALLG